jgi:transcriptional regulator with XRE-family HTH domain
MNEFSARLQYLLDIKKIGQKDIVEGAEVDKAQVSNWLTGKVATPRRTTIHKLADFFGCNIEWLATGEGKPWPNSKNIGYGIEQPGVLEMQEEEVKQVRLYRKLAQMDEDTLQEIQTWLNDVERLRPGFKGWFRLEFQNRFPEFDDWKEKIIKKGHRAKNVKE